MSEKIEGSVGPQPEKNSHIRPLKMWEVSSRIAHEPGSDNQELAWIEEQMSKLKVGENFQWTSGAQEEFTISKVDSEHYTVTEPKE